MHIHVGANVPGYLPESDVACFDDLDSAIEYLKHELKDQRDYYYEGCTDREGMEGRCEWCSVAANVEAALSAIADGDTAYAFKREHEAALKALEADGRDRMPSVGWIFSPPEGSDIHHWALAIAKDRESCEIAEEQGD